MSDDTPNRRLLTETGAGDSTFDTRDGRLAALVAGGVGIGVVRTNRDAMVSQLAQTGRLATSLGAARSCKEIGDMLGPLTASAARRKFVD